MIQNLKTSSWGIHWFRRDLRLPGNRALQHNWKHTGRQTLGLFIFDSRFLARPDFSHNRFQFFIESLVELKSEMQKNGGDLLVVDGCATQFFDRLSEKARAHSLKPPLVTWCRDYEPYARARDSKVQDLLKKLKIPYQDFRDHLLIEPWEISKPQEPESHYQVFTPFARRWFDLAQSHDIQSRTHLRLEVEAPKTAELFSLKWSDLSKLDLGFTDQLSHFRERNLNSVNVPVPSAGTHNGLKYIESFRAKLKTYNTDRDLPGTDGTSRLSMFLKNGSLTVPMVIHALREHWPSSLQSPSGPATFIKELVWREFYYSILWHRPDVETQSYLPKFRHLKWQNREDHFTRWKEGTTGFPIVDAGMRQLAREGWMHNRVRMIVASFLVKDLLIDWRWGENWFMQKLLDGDLAPNNGGWQWAASTGCDPQPYFRIFNPWLQSKKFDAQGNYIRRYVEEITDAPPSVLHNPAADRTGYGYPQPIVVHEQQRALALKLYNS